MAPDTEVSVIVNDQSVVIEQGDREIIVPREVHDYLKEVEKSEKFKKEMTLQVFMSTKNMKLLKYYATPQEVSKLV